MQQPSPSYRESYQAATVADAARMLGVSESTVRRLVRTGKLEAERVERPQGHAWLVKVPVAVTDQSGTSHHLGAATPINQPVSEALTAWTSSVLEPLVLELRLSREMIAGQAERLGYVTAELDAARAQISTLTASTVPQTAERPTERPGGYWPPCAAWLVMPVVLAIAAVVVLLMLLMVRW
jgi:excisionase family DNA binding protein